jgi:Ca2+-binding RTX toxin-like protein
MLGGVNVSLANAGAQNTLGSGTDTLANIENLTGTNYADNLTGTAGANVIDGGLGADIMIGGDGSDLYYVDNSADNIIETNANPATGGTDLVYATASYTLQANVENLRIIGTGAINATGNALANTIYAGAGNNVLDGQGGSDTVSFVFATAGVSASLASGTATGGSGADTLINVEHLIGSNYADTLTGNAQANTLTGGTGADTFVLNGLLASDTVTDFTSGTDKMSLSQSAIPIGNGDTTVDNATTIAAPGGFATTAELVVVTGNIAGAITPTSAAAAIGSATGAYAIGQKVLFVVDNGTASAAYLFTAADANAIVSDTELTLLATLSATPATNPGDWLFGG